MSTMDATCYSYAGTPALQAGTFSVEGSFEFLSGLSFDLDSGGGTTKLITFLDDGTDAFLEVNPTPYEASASRGYVKFTKGAVDVPLKDLVKTTLTFQSNHRYSQSFGHYPSLTLA